MSTDDSKDIATCTSNGYTDKDVEEVEIPVPWGIISGKLWGRSNKQPLVALHGWQDNAGSFDTLVPLLPPGLPILCIDLPGHGYSCHLPVGQFYHVVWDGIIVLRRIVKHYKWDKVKLIGHSLGGAISFLYAAAYPDEVDLLICLDVASPRVRNAKKIADETAQNIDKFLQYETRVTDNDRSYEYEDMIDIVEHAYAGSITRDAAEILMKRGIQPTYTSGMYRFSRDPRLKVSFLGRISMDLIMTYAERIKCAYLNIRALNGYKFDDSDNYGKVVNKIKENARKFEYHEVDGTHHVHLVHPERIAPIINKFIST